jgi:hypothetical protein
MIWQGEFSSGGTSASCIQGMRYRRNTEADLQFLHQSIVNQTNNYPFIGIDNFSAGDTIRIQAFTNTSKNLTNQKIALIKLYSVL